MKISAMSDCFRLGFEGGIRKAAEMGLDGVQFHLSSVQPQTDQPLEEGRAGRFARCSRIAASSSRPPARNWGALTATEMSGRRGLSAPDGLCA